MGYAPVFALAALLLAAGPAHAFGIGVRAGTTGIGADLAWDIAPTLSARVGYSALKWSHDVETSAVDYDGRLELGNLNTLIDFHPLGPVFRISGGLIFNDNKYDLRSKEFGGALRGTVEAGKSAAPYLGIGWGTVAGAGVNFYADLGIMFMGSPKARLSVDCTGVSASACSQAQSQAAAEQARLEDELKHLKYFPVLNLGLTIGF